MLLKNPGPSLLEKSARWWLLQGWVPQTANPARDLHRRVPGSVTSGPILGCIQAPHIFCDIYKTLREFWGPVPVLSFFPRSTKSISLKERGKLFFLSFAKENGIGKRDKTESISLLCFLKLNSQLVYYQET